MKTRGTITLVFDDGYTSVKHNVVPLLNEHRVHAVFAVPLAPNQAAGAPPADTWQSWLALKGDGHEIAAHSISHTDLTQLSADQLERELAEPARVLGATTLIYPGGAHNEAVRRTARRYYRAARGVQRGFENIPPSQPLGLRTFNFTRKNFSVPRANALALWACLTNSWVIETYHLIDDTATTYSHTVLQHDFQRHFSFLLKLPIAIRTIQEVCAAP